MEQWIFSFSSYVLLLLSLQTITLKERKYQQELQDLARQRAILTERLKKISDEFELKHNLSARHYLQEIYGSADDGGSENESDATESATGLSLCLH